MKKPLNLSVDKNKILTICLIIIGILGLIFLFSFVIGQSEKQNVAQIEQTRDTRLLDRKLAENATSKLSYFYGIYDRFSYYKAQQELKESMSDELYAKYFIDMEYESVIMPEVAVNVDKILSQELGDKHFLVKLTLCLTEKDTGNIYFIDIKAEVKNERIVAILS